MYTCAKGIRGFAGTIRLVLALLALTGCGLAGAATVTASAVMSAASHTLAAVKRTRAPSRPLDLSGPEVNGALAHSSVLRTDSGHTLSAQGALESRGASAAVSGSSAAHFAVRWQSNPQIVRVARQFRRNGLPIVRLWQSGPNLVSIGLNPHGVPGIWFTQKVPD